MDLETKLHNIWLQEAEDSNQVSIYEVVFPLQWQYQMIEMNLINIEDLSIEASRNSFSIPLPVLSTNIIIVTKIDIAKQIIRRIYIYIEREWKSIPEEQPKHSIRYWKIASKSNPSTKYWVMQPKKNGD